MRKKIIKLIESAIPRLYDAEGEPIKKKELANEILDALVGAERLDLEPFETWIPFACATCFYNEGFQKKCTYDLLGERTHRENPPPDNCPLGYKP